MADVTVNSLTELAANPAAGDFLPIWQVSTAQYKKITAANLFPFTVTGGGTIALGGFTFTVPKTGTGVVGSGTATRLSEWSDANTLTASTLIKSGAGVLTLSASGAFTFTVPKTGTAATGTGTAGRVAEWVTDANTLQASTLAKTGAGVLTLAASSAFTLTVPATGTASLIDVAQTYTAATTLDKLILGAGAVLTIAAGVVAATHSRHNIDTESAAATDDLDTINGGVANMLLVIGTVSSARDVTIKHGTGNILNGSGADFLIGSNTVRLEYMYDGSNWREIGRP